MNDLSDLYALDVSGQIHIPEKMDSNVRLAGYMRGLVLSSSYLIFPAPHRFGRASPKTISQVSTVATSDISHDMLTYLADGGNRDKCVHILVRTDLVFLRFAHSTRFEILRLTRNARGGRYLQASAGAEGS
jgi:hypothetical protein